MKKPELVQKVSEKFSLESGKTRKIVDYVLQQLIESGMSGDGFASSILTIKSRERAEKTVNTPEGQKVIPAKQVITMRPSKSYVQNDAEDAGQDLVGSFSSSSESPVEVEAIS